MYYFLLFLHILVCVVLVLVILSQSSKGAGLGGALGGVANNVMGGQGAPEFMKKLTQGLFAVFIITSLSVAWVIRRSGNEAANTSALEKIRKESVTAPAPAEEAVAKDLQTLPAKADQEKK
ncbi:MAG: preprotein translocase subunit SecG [Candidatus Cloacimonadota bacterium]|nr:MAG: preprotein translocase subunit SecG [Candidatus Cloacimonadota bacterium]